MADPTLTFDEIDAVIRAADLAAFQPGGAKHVAMTAKAAPDVLAKICEIYKVIRPILKAIEVFPLIPPKWREAIKTFTTLMDTLCP